MLKKTKSFIGQYKKIIFFMFFCIVFTFGLQSLNFDLDSDTMWHIKTGEWICKNNKIPKSDVFSWLSGLNWTPHETGFDILVYQVHKLWGVFGVKLLGIIASILSQFLCFSYMHKRGGLTKGYFIYYVFLQVFVGVKMVSRPHDLSVILLMFLLLTYIQEQISYKRFYLTYPVCMLLCSWLHGGYIWTLTLQMFIILLCNIVKYITAPVTLKKQSKDAVKSYVYLMIIGFSTSLLNPIGFRIYTYAFLQPDFAYTHISEWQPFACESLLMAMLLIFQVVSLAFTEIKKLKYLDVLRACTICFWIISLLRYLRVYNQLQPVLMMLGYISISELFKVLRDACGFSKLVTGKLFVRLKRIFAIILITAITLTCITFLFVFKTFVVLDTNKDSIDTMYLSKYSEGVITYLKDNNITSNYYNAYNTGGYLIYKDCPVFLDSRCDPYMLGMSSIDNFRDTYTYLTRGEKGWLEFVAKYDLQYIILMPYVDGSIDYVNMLNQSDHFKLVYKDASEMFSPKITSVTMTSLNTVKMNDYAKGYIFEYIK